MYPHMLYGPSPYSEQSVQGGEGGTGGLISGTQIPFSVFVYVKESLTPEVCFPTTVSHLSSLPDF